MIFWGFSDRGLAREAKSSPNRQFIVFLPDSLDLQKDF